MKRYYMSEIFNAGPLEGWRHRLQEMVGIDYVGGEIAVDPATGLPTQKALLVLVEDRDHVKFRDRPGLVPLADVSLDIKMSAIDGATKRKSIDGAKAIGFSQAEVDAIFGDARSQRDVLNGLGRLNNPDFDADKFDV